MRAELTIGDLAKELRLNPKTVRYYEEIGIFPRARRSESGYRIYSNGDLERLRLVKRAKLLGLSLAEIKEIVGYAVDGHCGALGGRLLSLVETKLSEIDQTIEDLTIFKDNLRVYYRDLSLRLKSEAGERIENTISAPCECIGEEVDSLKKRDAPWDTGASVGPGQAYQRRKEVTVMPEKDKKEPKPQTTQTRCGCGCLPVKK